MRISKAEIVVGTVLSAIAIALASAVVSYLASGSPDGLAQTQEFLLKRWAFGMTCLALAVAFAGSILLMPTVRRQRHESGKLRSLAGELKQRSEDLEHAAMTDPLTGVSNRRFFDEAMRLYIIEFRRIDRPLGLLLLDLDHFKAINDTHGHDAGDEVLRAVGACLIRVTRNNDVVARLGGEEFAIVAPNLQLADLHYFAERIRNSIANISVRIGEVQLRITVSIGLAIFMQQDDVSNLFKRADINLYQAKQAGRDRVCAFSDQMIAHSSVSKTMVDETLFRV